ncbi:bystin-like [Vitis riparia]|uniref:bystin-like n=1 Tax=Vitis riparia TaxID=96939 RepID=UPI00155AC4F8|nr:bystin-like [Vitis riparia]XP_034690918.1 bystin-like [Vitis riparia]
MGKKRSKYHNPQPFLADDDVASSKKRSKPAKHHQAEEKMISSGMSSKILKEALLQQKEMEDEARDQNPNSSFFAVEEEPAKDEEEDVDDFAGFDDTQSHFGGYEEEIDEEDEKLLEVFLSKNTGPERTLADVIAEKIKEKDEQFSSEVRPLPKLDTSIIDLYKGVGKLLNKYTAGKLPKAFKHIPSVQHWEEVLYLTEPENWSPNAVYQATRIFASNLGGKKAERFYRLVLLPRVREDIQKNKRLHFALYQTLKKSLYKPAAFFKGILFPLCESGTCNLREAVIIGSIIEKVSIPALHSSVALLKLAEMEYCGTTSYFIKILLDKKYALPYRAVDAVAAHFIRFIEDTRIMPVIWHQSLLTFVQRYKNQLRKEDKDSLKTLIENQRHKLVTPEISRELNNSRNRGEKEDDLMLISSPISVINKTIEEDRFDIPDVPMEED